MKKIISLIILLLMITTVSARTVENEFETKMNVILTYNNESVGYQIDTEGDDFSYTTPNIGVYNNTHSFKIKRDVEVEDIGGLENITKVMEELVGVSLQLATYGNDSKTYQEKYNEYYGALKATEARFEQCKKDKKVLENDSIQLTACQSELTNVRLTKNQCNSDLAVCGEDLTDQKASTQTAWVIGILIGAGGLYLITNAKKWMPAEKDSFQH